MPFLTDPPVNFGRKDTFILCAPLVYRDAELDETIEAPTGFEFKASVPSFARVLISPHGPYTRAAGTHDWLYDQLGLVRPGVTISRKECDRVFLRAMCDLEVNAVVRSSMYWAVRSGGWYHWNKSKRKRARQQAAA